MYVSSIPWKLWNVSPLDKKKLLSVFCRLDICYNSNSKSISRNSKKVVAVIFAMFVNV
jgi:hypothetical protein